MSRRNVSSQSSSQRSQSQGSSRDSNDSSKQKNFITPTALTSQQMERLTADLVTYLLISHQRNCAIKRQDIIKHVVKEYSKSYVQILEAARNRLLAVFGIRLVELCNKKGVYMLVNNFEQIPENTYLTWTESENARMGLLTIVLSIIFMNGNSISEGELFNVLKKVGVNVENPHPEFGDVQKLLAKEFVRQMYVEYQRVPDSDPVAFDFQWGPRAYEEVSKKDLLDFVCQVYGDVEPRQWKSQFKDAMGGAEQ